MSAEFITEYDDNQISSAIENMQQVKQTAGGITEYIFAINNAYEEALEEENFLQVMRTAQFITKRGEGAFEEEANMVYFGELFGLELINILSADNGEPYKVDYAGSFLASYFEKYQAGLTDEDTSVTRKEKWYQEARNIQNDLFMSLDTRIYDQRFERFAWSAAEEVVDSPMHQHLFMMGFRLILKEALKKYPSVQDIESLNIGLEPLKWENISRFREIILKKHILFVSGLQGLSHPEDTQSVQNEWKLIEMQLNEFNAEQPLINNEDLLNVSGEFYAITNNPEGKPHTKLHILTDVRGLFEGIHIVEAPSVKRLLNDLYHPENTHRDSPRPIPSPVIRLKDPVMIMKSANDDEEPEHRYLMGSTIDIPLTYKSTKLERIKAETTEGEH